LSLQLTPEHCQSIKTHAESTYPEECCGLLLGKLRRDDLRCDDQKDRKRVVEIRWANNTWSADLETELETMTEVAFPNYSLSKTNRYWIDPKEILQVQRYARDRRLDIIGIYHSHTDHPAVPSECDRVLAWLSYSYLIVSVSQRIAQDLLCWSLDENRQFQPEELIITPPAQSLS
jgi:proteasome lid subunit RPN8/RPN11